MSVQIPSPHFSSAWLHCLLETDKPSPAWLHNPCKMFIGR